MCCSVTHGYGIKGDVGKFTDNVTEEWVCAKYFQQVLGKRRLTHVHEIAYPNKCKCRNAAGDKNECGGPNSFVDGEESVGEKSGEEQRDSPKSKKEKFVGDVFCEVMTPPTQKPIIV